MSKNSFWEKTVRVLEAIGTLAADAIVMAAAIVLIGAIQWIVENILGAGQIWFGFLPLDYVFQAADLACIVVIGYGGLRKLWKALMDE